MPQKGTYTAYQQLTKNDTDFGAQQREQDKLALERDKFDYAKKASEDKAKQDAKDKNAERDAAELASLEYNIINNKSIDEATIAGINNVTEELLAMNKEADLNPQLRGDVDWKTKKYNLLNTAKYIKAASNGYAKQSEELALRAKDGRLSAWNANDIEKSSSLYSEANLAFKTDKKTGKVSGYTTIPDMYSPTGYKVVNLELEKTLDGRGVSEFIDPVDWQTDTKTQGSALGEDAKIKTGLPGYETRITSSWDEKGPNGELSVKDRQRILAEARFGRKRGPDPDGDGPKEGKIFDSWNNEAKSYWTDGMGNERPDNDAISEEEMTLLIDNYVDRIGQYYDNSIKSTTHRPSNTTINIGKEGVSSIATDETPEAVPLKVKVPTEGGGELDAMVVTPKNGESVPMRKLKDEIELADNILVTKDRQIFANVTIQTPPPELDVSGMTLTQMVLAMRNKPTGWTSKTMKRKLTPEEAGRLIKSKGFAKVDGSIHQNQSTAIDYWTNDFESQGGSFENSGAGGNSPKLDEYGVEIKN